MTLAIASNLFPAAEPLPPWRAAAWLASSGVGLVLWLQYPDPNWPYGMLLLSASGPFLHPFSSLRQPVSGRAIVTVLAGVLLVCVVPITAFALFERSVASPSWSLGALKVAGLSTWLLSAVHVLRRYAAHRRLRAPA